PGTTGIGHTRWATHGAATERNAHPHASSRVALVHNGIIENFRELKEELGAAGHQFESDTDTEVAVHLITQYLEDGLAPDEAVKRRIHVIPPSSGMVDKGGQRHFMAKEIHEQPEVVGHTISRYIDGSGPAVNLQPAGAALFRETPRLTICGCGTAFYAGLIGKYWFEKLARMTRQLFEPI